MIKGGRKPIEIGERQRINSFMESISSIAANRYLKKEKQNAFYCEVSLIQAYAKFENTSKISFSSFYKYVGDKFKKPHRFSDLCEYCEQPKVLLI